MRVTPAGVVFFDDTFANADWEMVVYVGGNGGTGSALQLQAGGDPGEARQITHHLNVGPPGAISSVFTFHLWQGMKFDPATDHAIASIDFAEDMRYPAARAQGSGLAVRQSGKVYYALPSYLISANADWKHRVVLGLTAGDFVLINSDASQGAGHPDFSASGAAIEVGFLRANSTSIGGPAYDTSGEVDNWWVNVHPVP